MASNRIVRLVVGGSWSCLLAEIGLARLSGRAQSRSCRRATIRRSAGARSPAQLGCFNCHGPGGTGGVPNPGSKTDEVPSFHEGTIMMYAHDDQDLREYILDGAPAAKLRAAGVSRRAGGAGAAHAGLSRLCVTHAQVDDLVAYLRAASGLLEPLDDPAAQRRRDRPRQRLFRLPRGHGHRRACPIPGSLKGYIPGFGGEDFHELVRNDEELRGWIADGGIPRLRNDPLASYFLERQRIQMPAFKDHLQAGGDRRPDRLRALAGERRVAARRR